MRVIVCGGRDYKNGDFLFFKLDELYQDLKAVGKELETIIEGGAPGADKLAGEWALLKGIDLEVYKADWEKHGKAAGPIRNIKMLKDGEPDLVIAFPGGSGTAHMVGISKDAGIEVIEIEGEDDGIVG